MSFDTDLYLARIGLRHEAPSPTALAALQSAQMRAIPFENTAPFLGTTPDLAPGAIWDKLVSAERGGYCFELNGLFGAALSALGYDARPILGRVRMGRASGGARMHLAQLVRFGTETWLADTGFGGPGADVPLLLGDATPVMTRLGTFRLREGGTETVLERREGEGWFPVYAFDEAAVTTEDIDAANFFCANAPASPFPAHLMMNRTTGTGRVSLFDLDLTEDRARRRIASAEDLEEVLTDRFGLPADPALAAALWTRLGVAVERKAG